MRAYKSASLTTWIIFFCPNLSLSFQLIPFIQKLSCIQLFAHSKIWQWRTMGRVCPLVCVLNCQDTTFKFNLGSMVLSDAKIAQDMILLICISCTCIFPLYIHLILFIKHYVSNKHIWNFCLNEYSFLLWIILIYVCSKT